MMSKKKKISALITLIIVGETIFFLPFVLVRIFRPTLLTVFEISNTELGAFFSMYGIVAMVSYIFGGGLADRFPVRNLMAIAMWITSLGGFVMAFVPGTGVMLGIYGFWGFSTIFLFWAALIRATREWGGEGFQGRAFSWLEGGRGATAATIATLSFFLFSKLMSGSGNEGVSAEGFHPFQIVILAVSAFTFLCGFLVWRVIPYSKAVVLNKPLKSKLNDIWILVKNPGIWLLSVMIICAYIGYKITDDFSLYAREVLGFSEVGSAGIGTVALWIRTIVALAVSIFADRLSKVNLISICFTLSLLGGVLTSLGFLDHLTGIMLVNIAITAVGIYAVRALYFAVLDIAKIPFLLTGTAVGIVSFIGYTPDVFMSPLMGFLLDRNPGALGHQHVFAVLSLFSLIGLLTSVLFGQVSKRS